MEFIEHTNESTKAVEVRADTILISCEQDALDIMATVRYHYNCHKIIIDKKLLCDDFFNLKTQLAGHILQKFSNYQVQLAITGDFSGYKNKSLQDFIFESNKTRHILFLKDTSRAVEELCGK